MAEHKAASVQPPRSAGPADPTESSEQPSVPMAAAIPSASKAQPGTTAPVAGHSVGPAATPSNAPPSPAPQSDPIQAIADALTQAANRVQPARAVPAHKTEGLDTTVKGGKFLVNGRLVNANGREIDEDGKILRPEELTQDIFGRVV